MPPTATATACAYAYFRWPLVANYPGGTIESPAMSSDSTYSYAADGFVNEAAGHLMERYDPAVNSCHSGTLPENDYDARAAYAANTNSIYVFGGIDGAVLNTNSVYNLTTDTWSSGAAMLDARIWPNVVSTVATARSTSSAGWIAASTSKCQVRQYDRLTNTWTDLRP